MIPVNTIPRRREDESASRIVFAHDLCGLDGVHLLSPALRWLELAHSADLVQRVAGHSDVVVALEDDLDVANVECGTGPDLGEAACSSDDIVDEIVGQSQDGLN